jgi:hypothetical protein
LSGDEAEGSQTIGSLEHRTPNYELSVFRAGHFAIKIGGVWMPGCICLNVNGVPQYRPEALAQMAADVEPLPDGRRIIITGHLTPDIAFTQTIEATPRAVALTYRCEALRDIDEANISVTAGPEADRLEGRAYRIVAADGETSGTWPPEDTVKATGVQEIVWPEVGRRDARTVFEQCDDGRVTITDQRARYTAVAVEREPMAAGDVKEVVLRFEAIPLGDAESWISTFFGGVDELRLGVTGLSGLLHNVRTDRGLLIEQLSINEASTHQVSVGRNTGDAWGGVGVVNDADDAVIVEAEGNVVNPWEERIEARRMSPTRREIHWTATRSLDAGPRRLRLLMYVAQWLEAQRTR